MVDAIVQIACTDTTATVVGETDDTLEITRALFPDNIQVNRYVVVTTCTQPLGDDPVGRPAYNWYAEIIAIPSSYSQDYLTIRRMGVLAYGEVYRDNTQNQVYTITGFSSRGQATLTPNP